MYHLFDQKHDESIAGHIQKSLSQSGAWLSIGFIFLLQFVNYGLENFKWRISYQEIKKESFLKTLKAVYAGNAIALFTPDRLGTFIGRFSYLKNYSKTKITYTTFVGNYAQLTTTLFFAVIGMILAWNNDFNFKFPEILPLPRLILIFTPVMLFVGALFYYQEILITFIGKRKGKWFKEVHKKLNFVSHYSNKRLTAIMSIAMLRYLIFVAQFFLAAKVFQLSFSSLEMLSFCGILYLFATFIPSPFMGNLGTREAVAVYLLSNINGEVAIISASLLVWLINVVFPSILGGLIFLTKKPISK